MPNLRLLINLLKKAPIKKRVGALKKVPISKWTDDIEGLSPTLGRKVKFDGIQEKVFHVSPKEQNLKVFKYQNTFPEKIVHRDWDQANSIRYVLEGSGDILREFSLGKDKRYILEKMRRVDNYLTRAAEGRLHPADSLKPARLTQSKNLIDFVKAYKKQPVVTEGQQAAKDMTLAIAEGDNVFARQNYNHIMKHLDKFVTETPKAGIGTKPGFYQFTDKKSGSTFLVPLEEDINFGVWERLQKIEKSYKRNLGGNQ